MLRNGSGGIPVTISPPRPGPVLPPLPAATGKPVAARRERRPLGLLIASLLVVAVLAVPVAFLLTEAAGAQSEVWHLIWRSLRPLSCGTPSG